MAWFDAPRRYRARGWRDYSLDFKLFFLWSCSVFGLIFAIGAGVLKFVPLEAECIAFAFYAALLISISLRNRMALQWRWPGVGTPDIAKLFAVVVAMTIFSFLVLRNTGMSGANGLPFILFLSGIVVFGILQSLNLVQLANRDFLAACGDSAEKLDVAAPDVPVDPAWKRALRAAYFVVFAAVWLEAMAFFYFHENYLQTSTRFPTAIHTAPITEHGVTTYVTAAEKSNDDLLKNGMIFGIPVTIALAVFLQVVLNVRIFPSRPGQEFGRQS